MQAESDSSWGLGIAQLRKGEDRPGKEREQEPRKQSKLKGEELEAICEIGKLDRFETREDKTYPREQAQTEKVSEVDGRARYSRATPRGSGKCSDDLLLTKILDDV